jgi:hypothetical protein
LLVNYYSRTISIFLERLAIATLSFYLVRVVVFLIGEGPGLLRLHSTYRHDLKIYSSDEGRVQVCK